MKLPVKYFYDLLIANEQLTQLVPTENIFMLSVPEDYRTHGKLPLLRVTEVGSNTSVYASDTPVFIDYEIQVDVWLESIEYCQNVNTEINKGFFKEGLGFTESFVDYDEDLQSYRIIKRYKGSMKIEL